MTPIKELPRILFENTVRQGLLEDLGRGGDLTTDAIVDSGARFFGRIVARQTGRLAGGAVAALAFELMDASAVVERSLGDGDRIDRNATLLTVEGPARAILGAERTALNLLGRLCGIASLTARYVEAVTGTGAGIVCTRKTIPGLRALEKYAVRCGGGSNHRFGLDDAVLIKDNHLAVAGSIENAVARVRETIGHTVKVELEVDTLLQLEQALKVGVDIVLLDNMAPDSLRKAVDMVGGRVITEASGGITLETAAEIAATGVNFLSVGALTHSAPCLDLGLDVE
ncbi:MAG: carboxylating nicotinate-nucleotide diphosphorylase [Acidobacteria bacterium]|nr:carboxylating nicotinate-nucleotide diphosphorylase [Acidobacteriota bacterium]